MYIGTVVKILHEKQKAYAVVEGYQGKNVEVAFPFYKGEGAIEAVRKTIPLSETRPTNEGQSSPMFVLIRQLVGVRLEEPKKVQPTKTAGAIGASADDTDEL